MKNLVKNIVLATIIGVAMLAVPSQVKADDMRVISLGFEGEYKEGYMTQETDFKGADFSYSYYIEDTPQTEITYFKVVNEDTIKLVGWESNNNSSIYVDLNHIKYNGVQYKNIIVDSFEGDETLNGITFSRVSKVEFTKNCFMNCKNLARIKFSRVDEVNLAKNCFKNCKKLEAITGLHDIKVIPEGAFKNCSSLVEITLRNGHTLKTIEKSAFEGCKSLREFWFISSKFSTYDNVLKYFKSHKIYMEDSAFKNTSGKCVEIAFTNERDCAFGILKSKDVFKYQTSYAKSGIKAMLGLPRRMYK